MFLKQEVVSHFIFLLFFELFFYPAMLQCCNAFIAAMLDCAPHFPVTTVGEEPCVRIRREGNAEDLPGKGIHTEFCSAVL